MDLNISTALSGSAGLAGLHWLLLEAPAREALLGTLQGVLDDGTTIGAIRLQRAKYKPGRYLTTYHAVELHGANGPSTRLIEVSWLPPGSADPRGERAALLAMQAEAIERGLASAIPRATGRERRVGHVSCRSFRWMPISPSSRAWPTRHMCRACWRRKQPSSR